MNTLEIILPLRNPTGVLEQTVKALAAQTDKRFSVLLSDNHSTQGSEWIDAAERELRAAGIELRRVRPPYALGRVEHWNWAHYEASGEWVKPIFAGDWLEADYVAKIRAASLANPECRYIYVSFLLHTMDRAPELVKNVWTGRFQPAKEMQDVVLRYGMQFGPPSAAAYERAIFTTVGGYPTALPICADSVMFCAMASRFGALGLGEALCHFNIHGARFSTSLPGRRRDSLRETLSYYWLLGYGAWAQGIEFCKLAFAKALARELRAFYRGK